MNTERLLKLADFLETIPKHVFTIHAWEARAAYKPEGKKLGECGFAGCALGWAAHVKLFRGLDMMGGEPHYRTKGEDYWGFHAAEELFEICEYEARHLFNGDYYSYHLGHVTPELVAARIRKLVRQEREVSPS